MKPLQQKKKGEVAALFSSLHVSVRQMFPKLLKRTTRRAGPGRAAEGLGVADEVKRAGSRPLMGPPRINPESVPNRTQYGSLMSWRSRQVFRPQPSVHHHLPRRDQYR